MSERRRILAVILTLALLLVPATLVAAHSFVDCTGSQFCVFGQDAFLGDWHDPSTDDDNWPCCGHHGVQNDDDSFFNDASVAVVVYDGGNQTGNAKYCGKAGQGDSNMPATVEDDGNSSDHRSSSACPSDVVQLP